MPTLRQRVQKVIDQNKTMHSTSGYSNAITVIYDTWQALSEQEQLWITLTLTANELRMLNCIQRNNNGKKTIDDLLYMIKNKVAEEQLAHKLGIENKEI